MQCCGTSVMSKTAIYGILYLGLCAAALISASSPTEVKLYVSGQFISGVCESSDVSYWSINDTVLNSTVINRCFGADIDIEPGGEGNYLSTVTFSAVKLMLDNSVVSCWMNMTVLLRYHLTVVEADLVYLDTEEFSRNCTNPSISSSRAPLFTYNDIPLVNVTINALYGANVTTLPSDEGHIQVLLEITGRRNSTLNNSMVVCWIDSAVIWRFHLIINESKDVAHTTTAAVELNTTTDLDDVNETIAVPGSPDHGSASSIEAVASSTTSVTVLLAVLGLAIIVIFAYFCKRRKREPRVDRYQGGIGGPPDGSNQVPPPPDPLDTAAVPQVAIETLEPPVTTQPVPVFSKSGRRSRHERTQSLFRYSDENSVTDPAEFSAVDTTCLQPITRSFSNDHDESEVPQLSIGMEEEGDGQSSTVYVSGKNVYRKLKGWVGSSCHLQCHYVADGSSDERHNESNA